jgi:hypothetical protein
MKVPLLSGRPEPAGHSLAGVCLDLAGEPLPVLAIEGKHGAVRATNARARLTCSGRPGMVREPSTTAREFPAALRAPTLRAPVL